MKKRCLLILVCLSSSHVAWSWLNVFIEWGWVRLLCVWLVLVFLGVHWEWALWVLNLLHVHLIEWFLWITVSKLLRILLISWLLLSLDCWPIDTSGMISPSVSSRPCSWSSPWVRSVPLPWSVVYCRFECAILFLPFVLKVSRIVVLLWSLSIQLSWLVFCHLPTLYINLRLESSSVVLCHSLRLHLLLLRIYSIFTVEVKVSKFLVDLKHLFWTQLVRLSIDQALYSC